MIRWTAAEREARDAYRKQERARRAPKADRVEKLAGPAREEVVIPPRPSVSPAVRARVIAKADGHCARLDCTETKGLEVDHIICRELGGSDAEHNLEALCGPHHKAKTARDMKMIAKARRIREARTEPKPPSRLKGRGFSGDYQPIPSRPFSTGRNKASTIPLKDIEQ